MTQTLKQYREKHPQALAQLLALIRLKSDREKLTQLATRCNCPALSCNCLPTYTEPKGADYSGFMPAAS